MTERVLGTERLARLWEQAGELSPPTGQVPILGDLGSPFDV